MSKKITVYSNKGTKATTSVSIDKVAQEANKSLILQAVHVYQDRRHPGTKDTKTRSEINITKKKIYRQKGTGGARHGAASAHIFVGGGVAFGPKPNKRTLTMSQAIRKKALMGAMFDKAEAGKVVVVEDLGKLVKTKEANKILEVAQTETKTKGKTLFVIANDSKSKAFRNLSEVVVTTASKLNAYDVYVSSLIVLDKTIL
jgi:large subunit ribosomal protein L4